MMSDDTGKPFTVEEVESVDAPPRARVDLDEIRPPEGDRGGHDHDHGPGDHGPGDHGEEEAGGESMGEKLERKRDYLEGFLARQPDAASPGDPGGALYEAVVEALREIYDPEIPVNIYDLGLIYGVDVSDEGEAMVTMTLTTPHCPVAESMPGEVELRINAVPGIRDAEVNLVWDPPWDPSKMSDEARLELGML